MSVLADKTRRSLPAALDVEVVTRLTVWIAATAYAVLLTMESVADHDAFRTGLDTAASDQLLWLLAHGHEPFSTVVSRPFLATHVQPGLAILTPLYWLGLGITGIFAAQSIALALTAPALYALARETGASPPAAALPALLWLVCPAVASVNLFEFRPDPFAPVLVVLSVLLALQERRALLAATMLLALGLKEDVALIYLVLGLLLVWSGRRRVGAWVAIGSALWLAGALLVMRSLGDSHDAYARRWAGDRGDSIPEALGWMIRHPLDQLGDIWSQSLLGLVALVLSTGGLALLAPAWVVLAVPAALANALSRYEPQHTLVYHYHLWSVLGLFVAAAIGIHRLPTLGRLGRLAVGGGITAAVIIAIVGGIHVHGVMGASGLDPAEARRALARVPRGAPVAATNSLLPHLSQRIEVYTLPEPFIRIDWGGALSTEALSDRAKRVRYVLYADGDQFGTFYTGRVGIERSVPDVRPTLQRQGFVEVAKFGAVAVYERR
jgi:uncharacterized membrane protein